MSRLIRLSDSGKCVRRRTMQAINHLEGKSVYPEDQPSDAMRRLWDLGNIVEAYEIEQIRLTRYPLHDDEHFLEQYELDMMDYGPGHPDLIVEDSDAVWVYEVKSSKEPQDQHWLQLAAYAHFMSYDPRFADKLIYPILYIAPRHGGLPREYPVVVTDEIIGGILDDADVVLDHADRRELPERPCKTPQEGEGKMCPLVTTCFAQWDPAPAQVITDPNIIEKGFRLKKLHQLKAEHGKFKKLKAELEPLEGELASILEPATAYELPDGTQIAYKVVTTTRVKYGTAVKAGVDTRKKKNLEPFTASSVSYRFKVTWID